MRVGLSTLKYLGSTAGVVFAGSILLAFISQYSIKLPFTPVPISLQTIGIFLLGGMLSPWLGFLSVLLYLFEGTIGLPVFAGGLSKPLWFTASTAGFLFSFLIAVPIVSKLLSYKKRYNWLYICGALILAQTVIFLFGMGWLACSVGLKRAFLLGVAPFFVGAFVKIAVATVILKTLFLTGSDHYE